MKPLYALILLTLICFSFSSCGAPTPDNNRQVQLSGIIHYLDGFASLLKQEYQDFAYYQPNIVVKKISSQLLPMDKHTYLKVKYRVEDTSLKRQFFSTHYILTTTLRTYAIFEISARQEYIEPYLWAWKEG